ncbi:MAG: FAD-dependent oxidoreductase [Acidobacteria bacterium]|nr:FAD-dependent oxidoreductase [Acidobacteriota bacterium]MBV9474881.1 FAD-dependent oxidoreductase [Acidobacteriota bacterium]
MSDDAAPGPDLQQGVRIADVADGAMLAGHVGEDAVLLVRKGEEFFAVDAFCTHYHGPLAEGALLGETLRCPWHHACFELRTGHGSAPAMRALRVYAIEREGDVVRVLPQDAAAPATQSSGDVAAGHIVILGAGAAGSFAAMELRRIGYAGRVTLITREDRLPYDKPNLSKDYLAGRAPQEWIPLRESSDYANDRIDLRLGATVERIDAARNELVLAGSEPLAYDRLILAPGARPRRLDVPTADGARVHYLRTWSDADALREATDGARNAVVIGASFIGLETAASLRERGVDVTVVGMEELPLERVLGREAGAFIQRLHESHGVRFRLGRKPVAIEGDGVALDDGSSVACDVVVIGAGVEPELALAESAGVTIDRGIVVDEFLQTSVANIFAAGDAARFPDARSGRPLRVEHWVVAGRQGQTAARNAAGRRDAFTAVPFFWSQHYDLVFSYVGHAERADDVLTFGSLDEHNAALVFRNGTSVDAVATLFRDDVSLAVETAMGRNAPGDEILDIVRRAF